MADQHLPECSPEYHDYGYCICDRLRQAEQRLSKEYESMLRTNRSVVRYYADESGVTSEIRADALDKARDAVAASPKAFGSGRVKCIDVPDALAAIDALRGES